MNPFAWNHFEIKKVLLAIMPENRYVFHDATVENIALSCVRNAKEYEAVAKLFVEIYQAGYLKSVEEHAAALKQHGLEVNFQRSKSSELTKKSPIFEPKNQQNN